MILTVVGCGDAFSSHGRLNTCFHIHHHSGNILLDCGATSLVGLKKNGLKPIEIETIIISHFHGDHFGGLPFIIIDRKFNSEKSTPLEIVGPKGIKEKVLDLQETMYPGTGKLIDELGIMFYEFESTPVKLRGLTIKAWEVDHSPPSSPHAYQISLEGKTIGFSGDTQWNDNLIQVADADLFICECNNLDIETPGHLSYKTILEKKNSFTAKRIVLSHGGDKILSADLELEVLYDGQVIEL